MDKVFELQVPAQRCLRSGACRVGDLRTYELTFIACVGLELKSSWHSVVPVMA